MTRWRALALVLSAVAVGYCAGGIAVAYRWPELFELAAIAAYAIAVGALINRWTRPPAPPERNDP